MDYSPEGFDWSASGGAQKWHVAPVSVVTVRIDRIVPKPWKTGKRVGSHALYIGRVLRVEHWDRAKKMPK
jgi:hypothetical protein